MVFSLNCSIRYNFSFFLCSFNFFDLFFVTVCSLYISKVIWKILYYEIFYICFSLFFKEWIHRNRIIIAFLYEKLCVYILFSYLKSRLFHLCTKSYKKENIKSIEKTIWKNCVTEVSVTLKCFENTQKWPPY